MPKSRILVTGGAGFIGSHTVVELCNAGYSPVIVDDLSNSKPSVLKQLEEITGQKISFYQQDYADQAALQKVIDTEKITGVIHFAAYKSVDESIREPLKYYRNNVAGLVNLLELLEKNKISSMVFSSSCTVYGEPDNLPVSEDAELKPATSPYGASKQICETILKDTTAASSTLRAMALRYFNPIGAHESSLIGELPLGTPANLVPYLTQAVAGLRPALTVYGNEYDTPDGTCIRDYIHVVDLAQAHVQALKYVSAQQPSTYDYCNVGTGAGSSVLEVITAFESATGQKVPYKIGPRRAGDIVSTYADTTKSFELFGWRAERSLETALRDAWNWQQTLT